MIKAAALVCASMAVAVIAQQTHTIQPTFRTGTEQVIVDAMVLDATGAPVLGLKKQDFTVLDRGQSRELTSFTEVDRENVHPPLAAIQPSRDVVDNSVALADRVVVVVIDDLHFEKQTEAVKDLVRHIVGELGAKAAIALVTTSGALGVELTDDRAPLLAAIEGFKDTVDPPNSKMSAGLRRALNAPNLFSDPGGSVRGGRTEPADLATFFADMQAYKTPQDVAKMLAAERAQRKALIWISGGLRGGAQEGARSGGVSDYYSGAFDAALDAMRRSNVVTYAVVPGDGVSPALRQMASLSGGFALSSSEPASLQRVIDDLDHYYLLGFDASDTVADRDAAWHPLEVVVDRPGVTIRYRRGYSTPIPPPRHDVSSLLRTAEGVLPNAELPLRVFGAPVNVSGKVVTVAVTLETPLGPRPDGASETNAINYVILAVDLDKKKVTRSVSRHATLTSQTSGQSTWQIIEPIAVPPGDYQFRIAVRNERLAKEGSAYLTLTVPDLSKSAPALGGVAIGFVDGARGVVSNALQQRLFPFVPTLDREFARDASLRVFTPVLRRVERTALYATVEVLNADGSIALTAETRAPSTHVDVTLPLAALQPGLKRLRVRVSDSRNASEREVGFVVK